MTIMQLGSDDVVRMDHAQRIREADQFHRARDARTGQGCRTAARTERRFSFVRWIVRPGGACQPHEHGKDGSQGDIPRAPRTVMLSGARTNHRTERG